MARHLSNPRLRQVQDRPAEESGSGEERGISMAQFEDLFLKIDHLQSTVSNVAMELVQLREYQASQKENNQKFWAQDWPTIIRGQQSLQDKCNTIEREVSELKPILKQIVDHEQRLREVERSVIKMGVMASFLGAAVGAFVTWLVRTVTFKP